jgi:hypothetical protein
VWPGGKLLQVNWRRVDDHVDEAIADVLDDEVRQLQEAEPDVHVIDVDLAVADRRRVIQVLLLHRAGDPIGILEPAPPEWLGEFELQDSFPIWSDQDLIGDGVVAGEFGDVFDRGTDLDQDPSLDEPELERRSPVGGLLLVRFDGLFGQEAAATGEDVGDECGPLLLLDFLQFDEDLESDFRCWGHFGSLPLFRVNSTLLRLVIPAESFSFARHHLLSRVRPAAAGRAAVSPDRSTCCGASTCRACPCVHIACTTVILHLSFFLKRLK